MFDESKALFGKANELTYDDEKNAVTYVGGVQLLQGAGKEQSRIAADKVSLDDSTGDLSAEGNHVIDRIFVADGCRWIIDYKTVRLPEAELAIRAESYRPQLERYASLFADAGLPLRLAIFFPVQDRLIELSLR